MNLTSFLANKCFEYFLKCDAELETDNPGAKIPESSRSSSTLQYSIPPPWSIKGETFKSLCDGCGECISACENRILVLNKKGYPEVDFSRGSCSFCGGCAESCPQNIFEYNPEIPPWEIRARINSRCLIKNNVVCRSCVEQCEQRAIFIPRMMQQDREPQVLSETCNGCGACYKACPVDAIEICQKETKSNPNK